MNSNSIQSDFLDNDSQTSLRIAFASSNESHLDEHLGQCTYLSIYQVTLSHSEHIESIKFLHYEGHNQQKIADRLKALTDCFAVYCLACGNPVRQQLLKQGTRVVIQREAVNIATVIPVIQANWPEEIAYRQERQKHKFKNNEYLNELADSQWDDD